VAVKLENENTANIFLSLKVSGPPAFNMRKSAVKLIAVIVILSVLIGFQNFGDVITDIQFFNAQISLFIKNGENSEDCRIPYYEPFDPITKPYMEEESPIDCGSPQLALTFMINDTIFINETAVNELKYSDGDVAGVKCKYYTINRAFTGSEVNDDKVSFKNPKVFFRILLQIN